MRAKSVDAYIDGTGKWQAELRQLRDILRTTPLVEEIKLGGPCYTYRGKNVVGLAAFKNWFCLWFHLGALLADRDGVLVNAQDGKTRALRQWRMTSATEIRPSAIRHCVREAIELVEAGKQREFADHISSARREATKTSRIEKILPMIAAGIGLNDKYRDC